MSEEVKKSPNDAYKDNPYKVYAIVVDGTEVIVLIPNGTISADKVPLERVLKDHDRKIQQLNDRFIVLKS